MPARPISPREKFVRSAHGLRAGDASGTARQHGRNAHGDGSDGAECGRWNSRVPCRPSRREEEQSTFEATSQLGVTIYEAISGRSPFESASLAETLSAILTEDAPPPASRGWKLPANGSGYESASRRIQTTDTNRRRLASFFGGDICEFWSEFAHYFARSSNLGWLSTLPP